MDGRQPGSSETEAHPRHRGKNFTPRTQNASAKDLRKGDSSAMASSDMIQADFLWIAVKELKLNYQNRDT